MTGKITFSGDSSLAIIETDTVNSIVILNLTDFSIAHEIIVTDAVASAHFLNSSNDLVVIFGANTTIIVDLTTDIQYPLPFLQATDYTTDRDSNIFSCYDNVIQQLQVSFTPTAPATSGGSSGA